MTQWTTRIRFVGSGTTLLAAERTGRRGHGIELDPRYCDVIIRRMAAATGIEAIHVETGRTHADMAAARVDAAHGGEDANPHSIAPVTRFEEVSDERL